MVILGDRFGWSFWMVVLDQDFLSTETKQQRHRNKGGRRRENRGNDWDGVGRDGMGMGREERSRDGTEWKPMIPDEMGEDRVSMGRGERVGWERRGRDGIIR